jgi:hypothetical protein
MARKSGEQVVNNLELKATVEPVHPCRAVNILGSSDLKLKPLVSLVSRSVGSSVESLHSEVTQTDL